MASPINQKEKARIWDVLRQRFKMPMNKITSKAELNKRLNKLAKTNKRAKQLKNVVNKTDFWEFAKSKAVEKRGVRSYAKKGKSVTGYTKSAPKRWSKVEIRKIKSWKRKGKSNKQMARWLRRSPSSVGTKVSRTRKKKVYVARIRKQQKKNRRKKR